MQDIPSCYSNEAAKRVLSKPLTKKEPIKPRHLKLLAKKFGGRDANLMNLRLLALCTVGFAGFLRFDELNSIKRRDIIFHNTYMKIFIEKSKTDVYRDGAWVVIAKTKRITCPVKILRRYVNRLKFPPSSEEYVFRALFYSKKQKKHKCRKSNKPLSYSRTRDSSRCLRKNWTAEKEVCFAQFESRRSNSCSKCRSI